jgi:hypothetical protein
MTIPTCKKKIILFSKRACHAAAAALSLLIHCGSMVCILISAEVVEKNLWQLFQHVNSLPVIIQRKQLLLFHPMDNCDLNYSSRLR